MRGMSRGSHGESRVAAVGVLASLGICGRFVFVHRYVGVESGRGCTPGYLSSLVSVAVTYNIFLKYDCVELIIWLAQNAQLCGAN
jgi:hypothetical protein